MHSWASFQINSRPKKILHLMMIKKVDYYKCLLFMYSYVYQLIGMLQSKSTQYMFYNSARQQHIFIGKTWCGLWESFYKIVQKWKTLIGNWMKCRCIEVNVDMADQALRVVVGTINLVLAPPEIHPLNPQQKEYDPILTI